MFATRFAPSPTGRLHKGHAFSALTAWSAAKATGGRFVLRIEDIDPTRCKPEFETAILEDLAWLGLDWETPVRRQSEHLGDYAAVVDALNALGGEAEAVAEGFEVTGTGGLRGGEIDSRGDHRLAMLGAVAGLASREGVTVRDFGAARISYPGFERDLRSLLAP